MKKTIIDLFEGTVASSGEKPFLWEKTSGEFEPTTYNQTKRTAVNIGAGLYELGVRKGDCVSILSEGRNAWIISELGILYAGAVSVPLSIKLEESSDLTFRLQHAEVKVVFVSNQQLAKLRNIKSQLPLLKNIIVMDDVELEENEMTLGRLIELGEGYLGDDVKKEEFMAIGRSLQNDDYATITYTSGTTADPKGVILTHRNYTANIEQALTCVDIPSTFRTLIILPLDHCFAHVVGFYLMIHKGASLATVHGKTSTEVLKNIPGDIKDFKPDFLLSVPALSKNFRKNIEKGIAAKGKFTERLFKFAIKVSYAYNKDGYTKGSGMSFMLKPLVNLFDKILYSKIRVNFGGRLHFFIGGGALLDSELQRFFYAIGVPIYQGYGLSEATPVISTNTPKRHRFGSSGVMVSPMEMKIKDDEGNDLPLGMQGEMVIKGENVMAGYWKNPEATASTVKDGWLYTGDMGYIGKEDGLLYVLGRYKSLLIASDGEKYSPEGMEENFVGQSPYIDNVILYNNQSPYTVMLLVPNYDAVSSYFKEHNVSEQERGKAAVKLFEGEISKYKRGGEYSGQFPERWLPATFALLADNFTEKNGLVNSTMKVVRGKVEKLYADRIEYMYTSEGKNLYNPKNLEVFSIKK